jgi:hypothetical protein
MKIRPVGAEIFCAGRHEEPNNRFSQFCEKRPKTNFIPPKVHSFFITEAKGL